MTGGRTVHGMEMPFVEVDRLVKPDRVVEARPGQLAACRNVRKGCSTHENAIGRENHDRRVCDRIWR